MDDSQTKNFSATDFTDFHGLKNQAFDFETLLPEIQDERSFQARGLEVIQDLGNVDVFYGSGGFELNDDTALHQDVRDIVANHDAVIKNLNALLRSRFQT